MNALNKTKKYLYFGIDISKETLDIAVTVRGTILIHNTISNESKAIKDHLAQLKASLKFTTRNAVAEMENTGIYSNHLIKKFGTLKIDTVVDPPLQIKNSLSTIRGKTDMPPWVR
ncbi:transposase [Pedobacter sp. W3I1]|uniref:IS110 family transposase n=1 Tax=Pedobacter sp. W3I1 TaxID=3042291 RepID=UPI0027869B5D|nr:transposase [Pedobacter sp. W3I1]MDQ0638465.1 transposase [Pedobacter sp. W3I1]